MFFEIDKKETYKTYILHWIDVFGFRQSERVHTERLLESKIADLKQANAMGVTVKDDNRDDAENVIRSTYRCPYCGSGGAQNDGVRFLDPHIVSTMGCVRCEKQWDVIYDAVGVREK